MIPRSLPKLQSSITILLSSPGLIPRLSRATTVVGFCFPTLSLLCLREVLLCLSCLFQEMASREGGKKLSCLLLPAASTGRCGDRCKFSWNGYTVLYACCRLQETSQEPLHETNGCAVFKVRRSWRNHRGPYGICSLTSSSTYPFKVKTSGCLFLTLETSALTEGRKATSLGGDRAGYRCLQSLGVKVLSEGEQEPRMGIQGCALG